jgi:type II secretory pathway component PulC
MSYAPNIDAARKRFVERVALAYFNTWAGFGFKGPEFTFESATKTAEQLAAAFPTPPVLHLTANPDVIRQEIAEARQNITRMIRMPSPDYDDGIVDRG